MNTLCRTAALALLSAIFLLRCSAAPAVTIEPTVTIASPVPPTAAATPLVEPSATKSPPTLQPTLSPSPVPSPTPTPPPPEHRIGIRTVRGNAEFFDRKTGEKFVPRGGNYVRLAPMGGVPGDVWHSTLNPGYYDSARAGQALRKMHASGFNTVRVFVDCCRKGSNVGDPAGGISTAYVDNVVDLLRTAADNDIQVLLVLDMTPAEGGYDELWKSCCALFDGRNLRYLTAGGQSANRRWHQDFIRALRSRGAPFDIILAYDLTNEIFFDGDLAPLNLSSGTASTVNGRTYDLSKPEDKQRMMDENLVYFIDEQRAAILEVDPLALVTASFFWPQKPNPARRGDPRLIRTYPALWESSADFIDLHPYPGQELTLAQYVENFEMKGLANKPVIMGEFGAARASYSSAAAAARVLHDWQVASCAYGFDGWLLWTWDTEEQTDWFNGLSGEGVINQVLAPANRPDPCQPGSFTFFRDNVALGKPADASHSLADAPPSKAVDGTAGTAWNSGDFPPQWIQIDLGKPYTISEIRLTVAVYPSNRLAMHRVLGKGTAGDFKVLHVFSEKTRDGTVLSFAPGAPWQGIRWVRIETTESASWVGWREIEVLVQPGK